MSGRWNGETVCWICETKATRAVLLSIHGDLIQPPRVLLEAGCRWKLLIPLLEALHGSLYLSRLSQ